MNKEMVTVTNEEMFSAIMVCLDSMEARMNKMESDNDMEFKAVRKEMDVAYKMLLKEISMVNDKVDRLLYMKDIDGYENMRIQVDLLTQGYQELKAKIG